MSKADKLAEEILKQAKATGIIKIDPPKSTIHFGRSKDGAGVYIMHDDGTVNVFLYDAKVNKMHAKVFSAGVVMESVLSHMQTIEPDRTKAIITPLHNAGKSTVN